MAFIKKQKYLAAIILLLLVFSTGLWLVLQPRSYVLTVTNQSARPVEQLRLFGTALKTELLLANIDPGQSYSIELLLQASGDLRYEITQGLTRVDTLISGNVATMEFDQQQLTIYPQNRFILGPSLRTE